jgi:TIR domain
MAAYLGKHGYLHDVFVSYAHGDVEQTGNPPLKDWSVQFVDQLKKNLSTVLNHQVSVFLDDAQRDEEALDRLAALTDQFKTKIEKSALLQVLMSPQYLGSRWCAKELEIWATSQPGKSGNKVGRIAVARVLETDHKNWPPALKDSAGEALPGWWFYPRDGAKFPFGWSLGWQGRAPNTDFSGAMINLAGSLHRRLTELDQELTRQEQQRREIAGLRAGQATEIYLYGRVEHRARWDETAKHLIAAGIAVKPGDPEPETVDGDEKLREQLARVASRCNAMLLVGADGFALDDDIDLIGRDRRNFIRSRFQKYLPCAIVDYSGLGTVPRVHAAASRGIDWLDGNIGWSGSLRNWLQQASGRAADSYGVDANTIDPNIEE